MNEMLTQARLSADQVEAFYHDEFVNDQVRDFRELVGDTGRELVVDIGGGCGFFACQLAETAGYPTRVVDMDSRSIVSCRELGVEAHLGDALAPKPFGDERIVCFNLILHHLVGGTERETRSLQLKALRAWHGKGVRLFVNEYIYQSVIGRVSPWLIYRITASNLLSAVGKQVGRVIPSFRANTFNVGVRFRAHEDWIEMFAEAGFRVTAMRVGEEEFISAPRRLLLIKTIRRDSFLLESM